MKKHFESGKLTAQFEDGTTMDLGPVEAFELNEDIMAQVDSLEMRKSMDSIMKSNVSFTISYEFEKESELFKALIEKCRKYEAMTQKEKTLYHTGGMYDTIICPNNHIKQVLIEQFGDLNYMVSNLVNDIVLFDSR